MFSTLILVLHVSICVVLVGIVLLQQGKGADAGVSLGSGGSNTLFGAGGADTFLVRLTTICAVLFFLTSMSLALQARVVPSTEGVLFKGASEVEPVPAPVTPLEASAPLASPSSEGAAPAAPQQTEAEGNVTESDVTESGVTESGASTSDKSANSQ